LGYPNPTARDVAAWKEVLLPMHGAYEAIVNYPQAGPTSLKYPIAFITDDQLETNQLGQFKAIIIPDASSITPSQQTVLDQFALIPGHHVHYMDPSDDWYNEANDEATRRVSMLEVRNPIEAAIGKPEIFVRGMVEEAKVVQAGFVKSDIADEYLVSLSNTFSWAVPKNTTSYLPPYNDTMPTAIPYNAVQIRVPVSLADQASIGVSAIDLTNSNNPLPVLYLSNVEEYRIIVPDFQSHKVIKVTKAAMGTEQGLTNSFVQTSRPLSPSLNISPNPSNGLFNVQFEPKVPGKHIIKVFDGLGQLVLSMTQVLEVLDHRFSVDLSNQVEGLYYLSIEDLEGHVSGEKMMYVR
ncbi:MAG: T9SS type A sorting domain-containing protein, partial [Bacteroidota bacterium]